MKHTFFSVIKDITAFTDIKKVREAHFSAAPDTPIAAPEGAVSLAHALHPDRLELTVSEKRANEDDTVTLSLRGEGSLPVFRPGQYINLLCGNRLSPVFLSGTPAAALRGVYEITAAPEMCADTFSYLSALSEGDAVTAGPPTGYFYRQPLRDGDCIAVIADRTGYGVALSMQRSENVDVFLCGNGGGLPDKKDISADTVFLCGRKEFCEKAAAAVEGRRVRTMFTDPPERNAERATFICTVLSGDDRSQFQCYSDEPLINALERNQFLLFNKCRTGDCAFCRARLTEGRVTHFFDVEDGRRKADVKFSYIHPCRAFPDSDVTLKY